MCAKWNDKYNPEVLAARLENLKQVDASGTFSGFKGFESNDYFIVLESSLSFAPEIPESEKSVIVNKAVESVAKKGQITAKAILGAVSREENAYLSKPKQNYVVATNISIRYFEELKRATIHGCPLTFSRYLPKQFNRKPIMEYWKRLKIVDNPTTYTYVRISVKAREEHSAFATAIDALDLLRGIWNLYFNRSMGMRFSMGRTQLINRITLGPLHTLHWPKGSLATTEVIWYEPDYIGPNDQHISGQWEKLHKFEQAVRKRLTKHRYKSEVEDVIRRYTRALDHRDMHVSFIELWSVLERMTSTLRAEYDTTIKRTVFLYKDRDLHKQVLQHLRNFRNANVHAGHRTGKIETLIFQLKRYVEGLLIFHLVNELRFSSMEEASRFFDIDVDTSVLKEKVKALNKAIKFLS
jgi:hypothetical protein